MSNHCASLNSKLSALKERSVYLRTAFRAAAESGDLTKVIAEKETYKAAQAELERELIEYLQIVGEEFVASRENKDHPVTVHVNNDFTVEIQGDLRFSHRRNFSFPFRNCTIKGDLNLKYLNSAYGLTLPRTITGYLQLQMLTSAEGLILPTTIGGDLYLRLLRSPEGLTPPKSINGDVFINKRQLKRTVEPYFEELKAKGILKGEIR